MQKHEMTKYLQCSYARHLVMPEMVGASILLDIHCYVQDGRELMVDMNTQPNAQNNTTYCLSLLFFIHN